MHLGGLDRFLVVDLLRMRSRVREHLALFPRRGCLLTERVVPHPTALLEPALVHVRLHAMVLAQAVQLAIALEHSWVLAPLARVAAPLLLSQPERLRHEGRRVAVEGGGARRDLCEVGVHGAGAGSSGSTGTRPGGSSNGRASQQGEKSEGL